MTDNYKKFQIINIFAVVFTVVLNLLANILPFNGVNTGAVADSYPNFFTPPGYVFAIWGVIYILLFVFAFYQAKANQVSEDYLGKIGYLYIIGAVLNVAWLILFHYSVGNTFLLFLSIFYSAGKRRNLKVHILHNSLKKVRTPLHKNWVKKLLN